MKISYIRRWHPTDGTVYGQTFRITHEENETIFGGMFKTGANYGNAYTGALIAHKIHGLCGYEKHISRIIDHNSIVFVGDGKIPY